MKTPKLVALILLLTHHCFAAEDESYGPPLESDIVALYVAPTRADEPFVATANSVLQYDKAGKTWQKLYTPPWDESRILGISGYAKSSQMLYVVHSEGIAASRDSGKSWTESIPQGYGDKMGELISITVHPENRKEATFTFGKACWTTRDYGVNFESVLEGNQFVGAAFSPCESGENPTRIIASPKAIYLDTDNGFITITPPEGATLTSLMTHPNKPFAYLGCENKQMLVLNTASQRGSLVDFPTQAQTYPIFSSESSLWVTEGNSLSILNFSASRPFQRYPLVASSTTGLIVQAHPRQSDSLYYAQASQLNLLTDGFNSMPSQILTPLDQEGFIPLKRAVQNLAMVQVETQSVGNAALSGMIAAEPSLTSVIAAAVEYNLQNPETLADWNRKARSRHWMPEMKIAGFAREGTLDVTRLDEYTDRYGIAQTDALRLTDQVRTYNSAALYFQWNLHELIYDEEQVDVVRERRYQADYRRKLATEITKLYYERIEMMAGFRGISHTSKTKALSRDQLYLAIREMTDLLNMICGQALFSHREF